MEEMSLESVNRQLERLNNEKKYLLDRMENILSLVIPKATSTNKMMVDGGERIDKLLKYTDLKDELALDERLNYINKKIDDLEEWRNSELKRLNKYDELIQLVVQYKEEMFIKDKKRGKLRHLTWQEIANKCFIDESTARRKYKIALEGRKTLSNK